MPHYFSLAKFVHTADSDPDGRASLQKLLPLLDRNDYISYTLGDFIVGLDPNGDTLGSLVADMISETDDIDRILNYASIAGRYKDDTSGWDKISLAACRKANGLGQEDRRRVYTELSWKGIRSYTSAFDSVSPAYRQELDHALERKSDSDSDRLQYWEHEVDRAQWQLKYAEEELKARLGE